MEEEKDIITKVNKLSLPATILLASLIVGGFIYASQASKQKSIEKQQQLELQTKADEDKTKAEQDNKQYVASRKNDCLAIYKTENAKWNNVTGWNYDETDDQCNVEYKDASPKSDATCDKNFPTSISFFITDNLLCKDGKFEKPF